jgi:amino acid adenylation domain-containing protein
MHSNLNPAFPFFQQAREHPRRIALAIEDATWTYGELCQWAQRVAGWLAKQDAPPARVGILASRTFETYASILGACWAGAAYVPISPKLPEERLRDILRRTQMDALVVDAQGLGLIAGLRDALPRRVLAPMNETSPAFPGGGASLQFFDDLPAFDSTDEPRQMNEDALAYIIFTSGTTGAPKGVMISCGNLRNFVDSIQGRYRLQPDDRVAQPSEVSFDNSVFDLFNAWEAGAALYVVPANQLLGPIRFLQRHAITVWYSVPSFAISMQRMKMLSPGALPALRYSAFAGEALPQSTAEAWKLAASSSIVDCLYGPTETTVVCTGDRFSDEAHITEARGIVSIGTAFPGMDAAIFDEAQSTLADGEQGEIAFSGNQVAKGYFGDEPLTEARFPVIDGRRWYLTGDLAYRNADGRYHHMGRVDNQVKISGNRVELEEVEAHLRIVCGTESVAAVAWPMQFGTAGKLIAFVAGSLAPAAEIGPALKQRLPDYMVPARIYFRDAIPMSSNGKIDRKELYRLLDAGLVKD